MKGKIFVDVDQTKIMIASAADGNFTDFCIETKASTSIVGNIYKGVVVNVLKGMQAAFVDIGLDKNAFLFLGDSLEALPLSPTDEILCQVSKEESGTKGARITLEVSLPGRNVIYTPNTDYIGISRQIEDNDTRERLESIIKGCLKSGQGAIARTVSETATKKEITQELKVLEKQWQKIQKDYLKTKPKGLVFSEGDLLFRTLRDMLTPATSSIIVNRAEVAKNICDQLKATGLDSLPVKVEVHDSGRDMLAEYGILELLKQLSGRRTDLKCGGYLMIDKTEALTVIDVNSGSFVGGDMLEETVFKVNLEAAEEIARQLRLRNISGIIVVDFINMEDEEHRQEVIKTLENCVKRDRVRCRVAGLTSLGLVEITRKKIRNDVSTVFSRECPECGGEARVTSNLLLTTQIKAALKDLFLDNSLKAAEITVSDKSHADMFLGAFSYECSNEWADKRIYVAYDPKTDKTAFSIKALGGKVLTLNATAKLLY